MRIHAGRAISYLGDKPLDEFIADDLAALIGVLEERTGWSDDATDRA